MPPHLNTKTLVDHKERFQKNIENERIAELECKKYKFLLWQFQTQVIWSNVLRISLFHLLTAYTLATHPYFEKPGIILYGKILIILGDIGVAAGAHRFYTHRSFKAKWPLRIVLLFLHSIAGQNSVKEWVRDHRVHHKYSETNADPHNSRRGFFFAHIGWLMMRKHPEVIKKGQQIDLSDLYDDPLVVFYERYFPWIKLFCCFILPTIIPPLAWGESWTTSILVIAITRFVLGLHLIFLINSAAHLWGSKPYDQNICPVENIVVSVVTYGDGCHNYHHAFPWDYRCTEVSYFFQLTTLFIDTFQKIGWAYDMKTASPELVRKMVENKGDGSHYKWGHEITEEHAKNILKVS